MKTIVIRIYLKDYKKIRRSFKAIRGETLAHYFERREEYLSRVQEIRGKGDYLKHGN